MDIEKHNKWALLVGVNRYKYSRNAGATGAAFADLGGAVEDVLDMRALLEQEFGFHSEHILPLTDEKATRTTILEAIETHLLANAEVGDIVVIHFSGHGSFKRLSDGRCVGTIVPHDSRGPENTDITGPELNQILRQIKASNITVVVDSCHSGNIMARSGHGGIRFIPPELPEMEDMDARGQRMISVRPLDARFSLLAAAGPHESAYEMAINGCTRGAFTYYFAQQVRMLGNNVTYQDVLENVRGLVNLKFPSQNPQLEGVLKDYFVFGIQSSAQDPYVSVWRETDTRIRLDAGRVFGVTVGSQYAIYEPGTKSFSSQKPIAEARIVEVHATTSIAEVASGSRIQLGARAVEVEHCYEGLQMCVLVQGVEDLYRKLKLHPHLDVQDDPAGKTCSDLHISVRQGCLVFDLALSKKEVYKSVLPDFGAARAACIQAAEEEVLYWAKWINVLNINNAQTNWRVEFITEPVGTPGNSAERNPIYYDNGQIHYKIRNNSGRDLFVSLMAFGDDGSINVVYPANGPSILLRDRDVVGDTLELESLGDRESELNILKLIATSASSDFRFLEMRHRSVSHRGGALNPLEQLIADAAWGARYVKASGKVQDWLTLQRTIWVHRSPVLAKPMIG